MCVRVLVTQSCLTLCNPIDCSLPGSSIHGILQTRILEWVTISFSKSTYTLKQNRNDHLSMCCLKSFMSLIISVKKNTEEWAGFGSKFGIIAFLHHAMGFGLWISTSYSGRYTNLLLTHLQSVCLSAEHAAQFLFDKYTVKDPKTKPCTLYKNKDGKNEVGFLGGILKLKYPVRVWGFLWYNVWCRASLVAHTIKNLSAK